MDVGVLRDAITVVLGVGMGTLSGLFGVGGGVLSQPGMRALGVEPLIVIGTALPVIIPGALSGTIRYTKEKMIRWPAVVATVPTGLLAAVVGGVLSDHVPGDGHLLQLFTALLLGVSAGRMARLQSNTPLPDPDEPLAETDALEVPDDAPLVTPAHDDRPLARAYATIGVVAGLLSGLLGIGGGVIMVPAFVQFARMGVKEAIATSLVCVGAYAVPGTVTHVLLDHVDWRIAVALIAGVIPGARVGAALTIRANDKRLRLSVGIFLGITAVIYAAGELNALFG